MSTLKLRYLENKIIVNKLLTENDDITNSINDLVTYTKNSINSLNSLIDDPLLEGLIGVLNESLNNYTNSISSSSKASSEQSSNQNTLFNLATTYKNIITLIDNVVDSIATIANKNPDQFKIEENKTLLNVFSNSEDANKFCTTIFENNKKLFESIDITPDDLLEIQIKNIDELNNIVDSMDDFDIESLIETLTPDKNKKDIPNRPEYDDKKIKDAARKVALLWQTSDRDSAIFINHLIDAGLDLDKLASISLN